MLHHSQARWFAVYTRSRAEKTVAREFEKSGIEYYLPLYKTLKQWSDRKKKVEVPLIRSYIFVHITTKEYMPVLQTSGVVKIVTFSGQPVPIPDWQIQNLMIILGADISVDLPSRIFAEGDEVRITSGAMKDLRGIVIKVKDQHKLFISISALNYHFTVNINPMLVEAINIK